MGNHVLEDAYFDLISDTKPSQAAVVMRSVGSRTTFADQTNIKSPNIALRNTKVRIARQPLEAKAIYLLELKIVALKQFLKIFEPILPQSAHVVGRVDLMPL